MRCLFVCNLTRFLRRGVRLMMERETIGERNGGADAPTSVRARFRPVVGLLTAGLLGLRLRHP